jgi:pyrroloquinoline quinone (PQQ) biosynthesis protein C
MQAEPSDLQEELLEVMDRKDHWAWPHFNEGRATRSQLLLHYQQEYELYIRDFPIFLSRVHASCPHADVRRDLAENLFEEETGKLSLGHPHPDLFLRMMEGLGFGRARFAAVDLLPESAGFRAWIDQVTMRRSWIEGAALATLFIEGSVRERHYLSEEATAGGNLEDDLLQSPLVVHYGVDPSFLDLKRAHRMVEAGHRRMAWRMILSHAEEPRSQERVRRTLQRTLELWHLYRDGVARACGIERPAPAA